MLVVQPILAVQQRGIKPLLGLRDAIEFSGLAYRAIRAFRNTPTSLVIITPPAFTLVIITGSSPETLGALIIFFKARLSYFFYPPFGYPLGQKVTVVGWVTLYCFFRNMFGSLLTVSILIGS